VGDGDALVLVDFLGAGEVAEVDFGPLKLSRNRDLAVGVGVQTLDDHLEDGVRATADGVVAGLAHVAVLLAALEQHEALGEVLALELLI